MSLEAGIQAEKLRRDGNSYALDYRFDDAIDAYTKAIALCPDVPIYWTNRALCYRKRNDWTKVEADCRKAIQLDDNFVKAHYMLGFALLQKQEYTEAAKELEKARDLQMEEGINACKLEQIWEALADAKYRQWEHSSSKRSRELKCLKEACKRALKGKRVFDISEAERFLLLDEVNEALGQVFSKAAEADTPSEVPDYLCCKITFAILRDPVITPSGVTYERVMILRHLRKVGRFDPTTRQPLLPSQLVPNLAIKEAVQAFLDRNGWAWAC